MRIFRVFLVLLLAAGLAGAAVSLANRVRAEKAASQVEIALDWDGFRSIAASARVSRSQWPQTLKRFQQAGVSSIALSDILAGELLQSGLIEVSSVYYGPDNTPRFFVASSDQGVLETVNRVLASQSFAQPAGNMSALSISITQLARTPLAFTLPEQKATLDLIQNQAGLPVIARAYNFPETNPAYLNLLQQTLPAFQAKTVIFAGDEVSGWRSLMGETAEMLASADHLFGSIEFSKQRGSMKLQETTGHRYLRVHSISALELARYQPAEAVERFVRAARERNIRVLYVNPITNGPDAIEENLAYIQSIRKGLERAGLSVGPASVLADVSVSPLLSILMALGIAAAAVLTLLSYLRLSVNATVAWLAGFAVLSALLALMGGMGVKLLALASALVFPVWAVQWAARASGKTAPSSALPPRSLGIYLAAIALSALGGIFVAALLASRPFMLQSDQFVGVKAAQLLPIMLVSLLAAGGVLGARFAWPDFTSRFRTTLRSLLDSPVLFRYAFFGLAALVLLFLVVARSGNDAGVGVSGLELRFRALLDQFLYVRPRTKEIFLGFPALLAAIWLSLKGERVWSRAMFVAGMIGLVSVVNTFCHIHSPFLLSVARVANGVWVGALFGLVVVFLLSRFVKLPPESRP